MNPIILKFGIPIAILATIAFMRWTNAKAKGEPFFPGVGDDTGKSGSSGGGGGILALGKKFESAVTGDNGSAPTGGNTNQGGSTSNTPEGGPSESPFLNAPILNSPDDVQDSGTYDDGGFGTTYSEPVGSSPAQNLGPGSTFGGSPFGGFSGGVVSQPPAVQSGLLGNVEGGYSPGYVPYTPPSSSTPTTQPPANQFGGMGGGGVFAL